MYERLKLEGIGGLSRCGMGIGYNSWYGRFGMASNILFCFQLCWLMRVIVFDFDFMIKMTLFDCSFICESTKVQHFQKYFIFQCNFSHFALLFLWNFNYMQVFFMLYYIKNHLAFHSDQTASWTHWDQDNRKGGYCYYLLQNYTIALWFVVSCH